MKTSIPTKAKTTLASVYYVKETNEITAKLTAIRKKIKAVEPQKGETSQAQANCKNPEIPFTYCRQFIKLKCTVVA